MESIHDKSYKELFSNPLFARQLFEGFLPKSIRNRLDFSTLKMLPGNYITPAMKNLYQDIVWAVHFQYEDQAVPLYLCVLLEFQSTSESMMPLRMLSYVAGFYQELIKRELLDVEKNKLPPVLPVVLYSGKPPWSAPTSLQALITPVPKTLRSFQPQLSYLLIDEHRLTQEDLEQAPELLVDMLALNHSDNAHDFAAMWRVLRRKLEAHPDFALLDRTIARWLAYTLHLRGSKIKLEDIETIDEATTMWTFESELERISEEIRQVARVEAMKEAREVARKEAKEEAMKEARKEARKEIQQVTKKAAKRMFAEGFNRQQIADFLDITEAEVDRYTA